MRYRNFDVEFGRRTLAVLIIVAFLIGSIPLAVVQAGNATDNTAPVTSDVGEGALPTDTNIQNHDVSDSHVQPDSTAPDTAVSDRIDHPSSNHADIHQEKVKEERISGHVDRDQVDKTAGQGITSQGIIQPIIYSAPPLPKVAGTEVSGTIGTQTWTQANSPYWITGNVTVPAGSTLTIEPGVQVAFNGSFTFVVEGALNADGTSSNEITFTSNPQTMTLSYDDGVFESEQNVTAAPGDIIAHGFSLPYPSKLEAAAFYVNNSPSPFNIAVIDGGTQAPIVPSIPNAGPVGTGWHIVDLAAQDITLPSTFAVGVEYSNAGMPLIGEDMTAPGAATFYYNGTWFGPGFFPGSLGIRVNVTPLPRPGDYPGIEFRAGGTGSISNCNITFATNGIFINSSAVPPTIQYNKISAVSNTGIMSNAGGFDFYENTINTTGTGASPIYIDIYYQNSGSATVGALSIRNNHITGANDCIRINRLEFDSPLDWSNFVVGQTIITGNWINNTAGSSITLPQYYLQDMNGGSVTWGDIIITDNHINNTGNNMGIYVYGYLNNLVDVNVNLGVYRISSNSVVTAQSYGIYLDCWDVHKLHETTAVRIAPMSVDNNTVDAGGQGIYILSDVLGDEMDGFAYLQVGDMVVKDNAVTSVSHGIYFDMDDYIAYDMYDYSRVDIGNVFIQDNTVVDTTSGYGIYCYLYDVGYGMYDNTIFNMGEVHINRNDVHAYSGFYWYAEYLAEYLYQNAQATYGVWDITYNTFNGTGDYGAYLYLYGAGYEMFGNSRADFADFIFEHNTVISQTGNYGLYVSDITYIGYDMYSNSQMSFGDIRLNWNDIDAWQYGFYISYFGSNMYNMYDQTTASIGNFEVCHNTIVSNRDPGYTDGDALYFSSEYVGYELWDSSSAGMGHVWFNDNKIHVMSGADASGLYISYIDYYGSYMYGSSTFEMTGNVEICNNWVNATPGYYGIFFDIYDVGSEMYGTSTATFQNFLANGNTVWADDYGIYGQYDYLGYDLYGDNIVTVGDLEMNNNTVWSDGQYGIYTDWYDLASYMYGSSVVTIGEMRQNDNVINATSFGTAYGWYCYLDYWAYDVYEYSTAYIGNYEFMRNTINSTNYAVYFDWYDFASNMYGYSQAYIGDFTVSDNHVNSTGGSGIYWTDYLDDVGYDMYEDSYASVGSFYCTDNVVVSNDYGIYASSYYVCGYYLDDNAYFEMGDIIWTGNDVNNSGTNDGIYFYMYEVGYYLEYNAQGYMGDIHIDNNTVVSGGDGIYMEFEEFAYYIYESAIFVIGDITMNDNVIDTVYYGGGYGISMYGFNEYCFYEIYDNSYAEMGDMEIMRNTINSNNEGIYWYYYYYVACYIYDNARVVIGDTMLCGNTIISGDDGMYLDDWYYVAYDVDNSAVVTIGDYVFRDNYIDTQGSGDGIYFDDLYEWGEDMDYNSMVTIGDWLFINNTINATGLWDYGIYMYPYDFGYSNYDNTTFTMGDWVFMYNNITSYYEAMYLYFEYFADDMYGSSRAYYGDHIVMYNILNSTDNEAIEDWWLYDFGYEMYDDSYAEFGDCIISHNDLTAWNDYALYCGPYDFGYYVYDTSDVIAGDYIITDNTIYSDNDYGIYYYLYDIGVYMYASNFGYSSSTVTLGDSIINDNVIYAGGSNAIYVDCEDIGYGVYYDSWVKVGNLSIRGNDISGYDGIYVYQYNHGYDLYNTASATIGWTDVSGNIIDVDPANGYGIYIDLEDTPGDVYDNAEFRMGDILVHDNTIVNSESGLYIYHSYNGYTDDYSYGEIPGIYMYNNAVNSSGYGLSLWYRGNAGPSQGSWSGDSIQVWGPVEVYDCTFESGGGIFFSSDDTAEMPVFYLHDLTFTDTNGTTNYPGIYATNTMQNARVDYCTFDNYFDGVNATSGLLRVASCDFTNVRNYDVALNNTANVLMVDCTFDKSNVLYADNASTLDVGWYLTVNVETPIGNRVPYADVAASSLSAFLNKTGQTDANGQIVLLVPEARYNQSNPWPTPLVNFNDYNVSASKSINTGWVNPFTVDASKTVLIILGDSIPPQLGPLDLSDTAGTTGDPFIWRMSATDDMGVDYIQVNYRIGGGAWATTDMTVPPLFYNNPWEHTMNLPDQTGTMEYYFVAYDLGGNPSVPSPTYTAPVTDNDAPVIINNTPGIVTPTFTFSADATDNMGVANVNLNYWYDSDAPTTVPMTGANPYNYTMNINISRSSISYYITATDVSGIGAASPVVTLAINDVVPPTIGNNTSDTEANTGQDFNFNITASDDWGIGDVTVTYRYDNGTWQNYTLTPGANDTYAGSITVIETASNMTYFITVTDVGGNSVTTNTTTLDIADSIPPAIISENSDTAGTTGETFFYEMTASDNIAIANAYLVYWYGTGSVNNLTLVGSGFYTGTLLLPSGSIDTLHYYFAVVDTSGNWAVGPQRDVPITDNDKPVFGTDASDADALTGQNFTFGASATDNVGITQAQVVYWFGNGTHTTQNLIGTGPYSWMLVMPENSTAELHYYFVFGDAAGNSVSSEETSVSVVDRAAPVLNTDNSDDSSMAGEMFTFRLGAADNIGISIAYAVYWVDNATPSYALLVQENDMWRGSVSVPSGSNLHYYFVTEDAAGNTARGEQTDIPIIEETANAVGPGTPWLYIIIIIILAVLIVLLLVTRNSRPEDTEVGKSDETPLQSSADVSASESETDTPKDSSMENGSEPPEQGVGTEE